MAKYCQHCRFENSDDAFWCANCNTKIINNAVLHEENQNRPYLIKRENKIIEPLSEEHHRRIFLKTTFFIGIISIFCLLAYIFLNNFNLALGYTEEFEINCQINEDFWFDGNYLNSSEGWSFELTKVKDYTLEGRILALKTYDKNDIPYNPCNIFSPIDLVIGIDDVQINPDKYDYSITSFDHRTVSWYLNNDDSSDYLYFKSHTGNNHIIPHTKEVLDALANNISTGNIVILQGSLINLYGTKDNQYWRWTTDTNIGNYDCEIILVDEIEILND